MSFSQKYFQENELAIKDKKLKYYLSPTLLENNFKHGFFTRLNGLSKTITGSITSKEK